MNLDLKVFGGNCYIRYLAKMLFTSKSYLFLAAFFKVNLRINLVRLNMQVY